VKLLGSVRFYRVSKSTKGVQIRWSISHSGLYPVGPIFATEQIWTERANSRRPALGFMQLSSVKLKVIASLLGPVVRKPVNADLGLKFNQGPCFSYFKRVFARNSK